MNPDFISSGNKNKRKKNRDSARINAQQRIIEMSNQQEKTEEEPDAKKEIDVTNIEQKICIIGIVLFVIMVLGGVGYLIYKIKTMYKSKIQTGLNEINSVVSDANNVSVNSTPLNNTFTNNIPNLPQSSINPIFTDPSKYNDLL